MSNGSVTFKCPSCGAYLEYNPDGSGMSCPYCGSMISEEELRQLSRQQEAAEANDTNDPIEADEAAKPQVDDARLRTYHCAACGAEVVTDDTTAATRCYYCHSPVVLSDRLDGSFRPDTVIPFRYDRDTALKRFREHLAKKKFVDHDFFSGASLEEFYGVYYPYWSADVEGEATFNGEGRHVDVSRTPRETVTRTRYYDVRREGTLHFRNIFRQALSKNDRQLTDGIHPYDLSEEKPFAMGYLSGYLAEKRDVEASVIRPDVLKEVNGYVEGLMTAGSKYDSIRGTSTFDNVTMKLKYLLLPAWVMTYRGQGDQVFYYLMNGQTGTVCGKLPIDRKKLFTFCAALGGILAGLLCLGGALIW